MSGSRGKNVSVRFDGSRVYSPSERSDTAVKRSAFRTLHQISRCQCLSLLSDLPEVLDDPLSVLDVLNGSVMLQVLMLHELLDPLRVCDFPTDDDARLDVLVCCLAFALTVIGRALLRSWAVRRRVGQR